MKKIENDSITTGGSADNQACLSYCGQKVKLRIQELKMWTDTFVFLSVPSQPSELGRIMQWLLLYVDENDMER